MPIAFNRLSRRLLRTAKGRAGLVTRQVSSRNTLPFCRGIPYRKEGTSCSAPHTPSPAAGCSKSLNLQTTTETSRMENTCNCCWVPKTSQRSLPSQQNRKEGISCSAPHTPSPAAGCSKSRNLQQQSHCATAQMCSMHLGIRMHQALHHRA